MFDDRRALHDEVFKAEICCKSWLSLFHDLQLQLPKDCDIAIAFHELNLTDQELQQMAEKDSVFAYFCAEIFELREI